MYLFPAASAAGRKQAEDLEHPRCEMVIGSSVRDGFYLLKIGFPSQ
jgi:hypothetical protein